MTTYTNITTDQTVATDATAGTPVQVLVGEGSQFRAPGQFDSGAYVYLEITQDAVAFVPSDGILKAAGDHITFTPITGATWAVKLANAGAGTDIDLIILT